MAKYIGFESLNKKAMIEHNDMQFEGAAHFEKDIIVRIIGTGESLDVLLFYKNDVIRTNQLLKEGLWYTLIKDVKTPLLQLHSLDGAVTGKINLALVSQSGQRQPLWFDEAENVLRIVILDESTEVSSILTEINLIKNDVKWLREFANVKICHPDGDPETDNADLIKKIKFLFRNLRDPTRKN